MDNSVDSVNERYRKIKYAEAGIEDKQQELMENKSLYIETYLRECESWLLSYDAQRDTCRKNMGNKQYDNLISFTERNYTWRIKG